MQVKGGRVHHVVGLVHTDNFDATIARMENVLGARFWPRRNRSQIAFPGAIRPRSNHPPLADCR